MAINDSGQPCLDTHDVAVSDILAEVKRTGGTALALIVAHSDYGNHFTSSIG